MAMPHKIQMQLIRERLKNKEGRQKLQEISQILRELPGFNTGPYGEIKKWLKCEIDKTKTKSHIKHQDWLGVVKEGSRQFVLIGLPSVGKSSLIKELSGLQTKIAEYAFTTLKPMPAVVRINNADFQIIDLPGLVEGAYEDVGGGRRLLGIAKNSDGIILMHDLSKPLDSLDSIINELGRASIKKPMIVVGNKIDLDSSRKNFERLREKFQGYKVLGISTVTKEGIQSLKDAIWEVSGLIRIYPFNQSEPVILDENSTIRDFASKIHNNLVKSFRFARVTGKSAKFPRQQVGLGHTLSDGDIVEIVTKN